jgi:DnaJ-class molecular chaperone
MQEIAGGGDAPQPLKHGDDCPECSGDGFVWYTDSLGREHKMKCDSCDGTRTYTFPCDKCEYTNERCSGSENPCPHGKG